MDIFVADINDFKGHMERLLPQLPEARQQRILRAPTEEKKLLTLCGGVLLRSVAGDAPLAHGDHGKPYLPHGPHFSLSHAGELAVLAVSDAPVGVDVEKPRPMTEAVIRRVLQEDERQWMAADPQHRFFRLWTRKEAVLKCCGRGLSLAMDSFRVLPGDTPTADGMICHLTTMEHKGHILSAASAAGNRQCRLIPFYPEE